MLLEDGVHGLGTPGDHRLELVPAGTDRQACAVASHRLPAHADERMTAMKLAGDRRAIRLAASTDTSPNGGPGEPPPAPRMRADTENLSPRKGMALSGIPHLRALRKSLGPAICPAPFQGSNFPKELEPLKDECPTY